jgi:hypothetical protein
MQKNRERLQHALHNEQVCDYLVLKVEFADWVITTAFYASLQFVSYKVFPFELPSIDGKKTKIESLDDYYRYNLGRNASKHQLLADLVEKYCNSISPEYDWLLSMSMNSRYSNYQQDNLVSQKAVNLMKKIKLYCTK